MTAEDYFQPIAEEVFSNVLHDLGAKKVRSTPLLVRFESIGWFVELYVLPEDGPLYCPRVDIGPLPELGFMSREKQVDILHALPDGSPLKRYNLDWIYSNALELRQFYPRVRDEIFKPYAIPLLADPVRLKNMVATRARLIQQEWEEEIANHNDSVYRANARLALADNDAEGFLGEMAKIPEERMTPSEQARVRYARKHGKLAQKNPPK